MIYLTSTYLRVSDGVVIGFEGSKNVIAVWVLYDLCKGEDKMRTQAGHIVIFDDVLANSFSVLSPVSDVTHAKIFPKNKSW